MISQDKLLRILAIIAACLVLVCIVATIVFFGTGAGTPPIGSQHGTDDGQTTETTDGSESVSESVSESESGSSPVISTSVFLAETPDMGLSYQDKLTFFGESTTAHLKSRGVLTGGKNTSQVWYPEGNTIQLQNTLSQNIYYVGGNPDGDKIGNIAAEVRPEYLILCFGLNGIEKFASGENGKKLFISSYQSLIDEIKKNSPNTKIILQGVYPVSKECKSLNAVTVNEYLRTVNTWTMKLAEDNGLKYLDAASVVTDKDGFLMSEYDIGDGVHITAEGYKQVLAYIRTHAWSAS